MQDLRLIGVHEGGDHLLLADADGTRYRLPLDEPLRAAARKDRPRLGQLQIEIEGGLRPRDVQSLIRSGLTTDEVAARSGWSVEKVRRFEGPVLAEREFMAIRAQRTVLSHDGRVTLGDRSSSRLRTRGVQVEDVAWDSHREDSGQWLVSVTFSAGGRQRTASWRFDPKTDQLRAQNDDARWLGEDEKAGPMPAPHVAHSGASSDEVFDVTRPARSVRPSARADRGAGVPSGREQEDELTESLRAHSTQRGRRGRRRPTEPGHAPGEHLAPVDALPLEPLLGNLDELGPPPDRPRVAQPAVTEGTSPGADPQVDVEDASSAADTARDASASAGATDSQARATKSPARATESQARATESAAGPSSDAEPEPEVEAESEPKLSEPAPDDKAEPKADTGRRGRARVPSWDDVVFGTRSRPSSPDR